MLVALSAIRLVTGISDISSSGTLGATLALAMPLALAGLGGLWSERAGVINIGLEGMMILGTWGAAFGAIHGGPWMGIVGAMVCGAVGGLVHALATVTFGVDHIVSGVALFITGDLQAQIMFKQQPMKMAAAEGLYETSDSCAPFSIFTVGTPLADVEEMLIRATLDGLKSEASPRMVAQRRGKKVADILPQDNKPAAEPVEA